MMWMDYPELRKIKRLARLDKEIRALTGIQIGEMNDKTRGGKQSASAKGAHCEHTRGQFGEDN